MYSDWPVGCFEGWGFPCSCFVLIPFHHQHWQHKQSNPFLFRNTSCGKTIKKTSLAIHLKCAETSNPIFDEIVFPSEISENTWPRQQKNIMKLRPGGARMMFLKRMPGQIISQKVHLTIQVGGFRPICSTYLHQLPTSHCFTCLQVTQISPWLIFGQTTSFTRSFAYALFSLVITVLYFWITFVQD